MITRFLHKSLLTGILCFAVQQTMQAQTMVQVNASDAKIQYAGRINDKDPDHVKFSFPGVTIRAKFEGTAIDALLTEHGSGGTTTTNYFNVIIDNDTTFTLKLLKTQAIYELARELKDTIHTIELFKRTESSVGSVTFNGFQLESGKSLLTPDALPEHKIEFIGNSITCGYGNEVSTTDPNSFHFTSVNENNYKAWGAITARNVNAQYSCVAYSGRGMYMNNTGSTTNTLPKIYDHIIADDASNLWDHTRYTPDIIVINLGTNDFAAEASGYATLDSAKYVSTYIDFITKLRGYYPTAKIICAVGVMMSDYYPVGAKHWTRIQRYVNGLVSYKKTNGDKQVYYLKMNPQSSPYGEDWHPTAKTQNDMANTLTTYINNLGWTIPSAISEQPMSNTQLFITPNPAQDNIVVSLPAQATSSAAQHASFTIYNQAGQSVLSSSSETTLTSYGSTTDDALYIDIHQLQTGVYHLSMNVNGLVYSSTFIKK